METRATEAGYVAREATGELREAGVPEPEASAEVLLCELLGIRRGEIPTRQEPLTSEQLSAYGAMISRRIRREPVQRILGYAYFRTLRLDLSERVLIPRPDTESVVDVALERVDLMGYPCRVLDLGTGSGAIALSVARERPGCDVHASDVSEEALETARENAGRERLDVKFHHSDLTGGLDSLAGRIDLLVSNPPYVKSREIETLAPEVRDWDPRLALDGGPDGLEFYRAVFRDIPALLKPGSEVVLEVGDGQAREVPGLVEAAGFESLGERRDLAGSVRAVILGWPG